MDLTHVNRKGTSTNRDRNNSLRSRKGLSSKLYSSENDCMSCEPRR